MFSFLTSLSFHARPFLHPNLFKATLSIPDKPHPMKEQCNKFKAQLVNYHNNTNIAITNNCIVQ